MAAWGGGPLGVPEVEVGAGALEVGDGDAVGGGGFSTVHRGLWLGAPVAVKRWFFPRGHPEDDVRRDFRGEVSTLARLRHPNVVQCFGASARAPDLLAVLEYLPHSLHAVLHESPTVKLDRRRALDLLRDAARALRYLHSLSPPVVHRDVKPSNFLVDRAWKVKLCDFGLAVDPKAGAGTPAYMAPELFRADAPYGPPADVYAFGVLMWEVLTRELPFGGMGAGAIRAAVLGGERPVVPLSCPTVLGELMQACWSENPGQRPDAATLLQQLKDAQAALPTARALDA